MATAILRFWTTSGLVLGADGLKYDVMVGRAIGTDTQKVFEIPGLPAAYAMYGEIGIGDNKPDTPILLDISQEIRKFLEFGDHSLPFDFLAYANRIAADLHQSIAATKDRGAIWGGNQESIRPGQVIARIILCGFFDGKPMEININFEHLNQRLLPPRVFPVDLQRSNPEVFGSLPITQRLFKQPQSPDLSLSEAAKKIERYVQFCDSERGRKLDPIMCRTIGGHIHIAAITPRGFQWLKPPVGA
jgi:hypothetical protein